MRQAPALHLVSSQTGGHMERILLALTLVTIFGTAQAFADDFESTEAQIDEISDSDPDSEAVDQVAEMPLDGEDVAKAPASAPQVNEQIENALDNLSETETVNNEYETENGSLRSEIQKLKMQCASNVKKAKAKRVAKSAAIKKAKSKKIAKAHKQSKKLKKADSKRIPASTKRKANLHSRTQGRVYASNDRGLPTELPKKRTH
jgi:hypothetical protein